MTQFDSDPVRSSIARSDVVMQTKSIPWHIWDFTRNFILPTIGVVWVVVETVTGQATLANFLLFFIAVVITGLAMSLGLHRLFSHRAFDCAPSVRYTLAVLGSMTWQRSLFMWAGRHRIHHKYTDVEGDYHSPYTYFDGKPIKNPVLRFLHAHYYWLHVADPGLEANNKEIPDLMANPVLVWIDKKYDMFCVISLLIPGLIGYAMYGTGMGFVEGVMWGGLARIAVVQHFVWAISSFGHIVGPRPYKEMGKSTNVTLLGWLVFGEGYHNNHHAFPYSPHVGFDKGQPDLGYRILQGLEKLGLVYDMKPIPDEAARARKRN